MSRKVGRLGVSKSRPVLIPVDAADAWRREAQSIKKPTYQRVSFADLLPQPKEVATISIAVPLEARQNLSEEIVTGLTKLNSLWRVNGGVKAGQWGGANQGHFPLS